jgi:hypothetical protein
MPNGAKPQSSVDPSRSLGMCSTASARSAAASAGISTRGFCTLITPMQRTCSTPSAFSRLYSPGGWQTRSLSGSLASWIRT